MQKIRDVIYMHMFLYKVFFVVFVNPYEQVLFSHFVLCMQKTFHFFK